MSLIYTSPDTEDLLNVHCPTCGRIVMVGTQEEISILSCAGVVPECFTCKPGPCEQVPRQLIDDERQCYLVSIDGLPYLFSWVWAGEKYGEQLMSQRISWPNWFALKTGWGK